MKQLNDNPILTFNTWLPVFPGFNNTLLDFDHQDTDNEYERIADLREEYGINRIFHDDMIFDEEKYMLRVIKNCAIQLEKTFYDVADDLCIAIQFHEPKRSTIYDYDSININVFIRKDQLLNLIDILIDNKKRFANYLKAKSVSNSALFSVDQLIDGLKNNTLQNATNQMGFILEFCAVMADDNYKDNKGEYDFDLGLKRIQENMHEYCLEHERTFQCTNAKELSTIIYPDDDLELINKFETWFAKYYTCLPNDHLQFLKYKHEDLYFNYLHLYVDEYKDSRQFLIY